MWKRICCFSLLAFALGTLPARASSISLSPSSPVIAGSTFNVDVLVNNVFDPPHALDILVGFGFNVAVDAPAIFQYVNATIDPLFDDASFPGSPDVFAFTHDPLGIAAPFVGPLRLATLHFLAVAPGITSVRVTSDLSDLNQGLFFAPPDPFDDLPPNADITGAVRVTASAAPVPEPTTLLLMTPLAGFLRRRKRRA